MGFKFLTILILLLLSEHILNAQPASFLVTSSADTVALAGNNEPVILNYKQGKFGLRNENASPGRRFWRSQLLIGGTELVGMGVLMILPKKITKWDSGYLKEAAENFRESWTKAPVWDKDHFTMNYIAHPLVGSYYYNAMRSQGSKTWSAFLFSTAQSVIWEYCIEGFAERPSTQDLIITSTAGALLGEAIHRGTLRMGRNGFNTFEKIVVSIINPLFILNNKFSYQLNEQRQNTIYSLHK
jgi:hypothetical protein